MKLTNSRLKVLQFLSKRKRPIGSLDMAAKSGMPRGTVTPCFTFLVAAGLVEKVRVDNAKKYRITAKGLAVLPKVAKRTKIINKENSSQFFVVNYCALASVIIVLTIALIFK